MKCGPSIEHHDVARLEVAIQEMRGVGAEQERGQPLEIVLEPLLVERHVGEFQEVVLEVVQVPQYRLEVERRPRIGQRIVDHPSTHDLEPGQCLHDAAVERHHGRGKWRVGVRFPRLDHGVEERRIAEILLQPDAGRFIDAVEFRHGQAGGEERFRERNERAVLLVIRAHGADGRAQVVADQAVVAAVRPVAGDLQDRARRAVEPRGV
jgi:hypothetical protein